MRENNCLPIVKYVSARNLKKEVLELRKQWLKNYLDATTLQDVDLIWINW